MTALSSYLSAQAVAGAEPVHLVVGLVVAWSVGNRKINVLGNDVPELMYDAAVTLAPGDAAAVLVTGSAHLVLCKVATA